MKIAHLHIVSLFAVLSCAPISGTGGDGGDASDHSTPEVERPRVNEEPGHVVEEWSESPCGYQDIVLEDPMNHANDVVITIPLPCSPYFIDTGRPLPVIKK